MLGGEKVGKSSLVSQFMTSEYLHAYDTSIGEFNLFLGQQRMYNLFRLFSLGAYLNKQHRWIFNQVCKINFSFGSFVFYFFFCQFKAVFVAFFINRQKPASWLRCGLCRWMSNGKYKWGSSGWISKHILSLTLFRSIRARVCLFGRLVVQQLYANDRRHTFQAFIKCFPIKHAAVMWGWTFRSIFTFEWPTEGVFRHVVPSNEHVFRLFSIKKFVAIKHESTAWTLLNSQRSLFQRKIN